MTPITIFCALCLLLFLGKITRIWIPLLQRLYLPSSVIGGIIGLVLLNLLKGHIPADFSQTMSRLPGFLINIIFASLFLGTVTPKLKEIFRRALPQICMGQLFAWGQYVIGLTLTGFLFVPLFGTSIAFGNLLEIGFEGGHGTVGGMTETFKAFNWENGIALGFTMATIGMVLGIVGGMALVNWALKRSIITTVRTFDQRSRNERIGIYQQEDAPSAGKQTVLCDSIDSLAWHIALLGLAVLLGYGMLQGLARLEILLLPNVKTRIFNGFPFFPLCMIGGSIIQMISQKLRVSQLIDHGQMQRLGGASLDFLIVSAVATIKLSVVMENWLPLLILSTAGLVWGVFMVVFVAPRLLPEAWFECAIAEFGQALGVTATGLMLLRTVDPEQKTPAATNFGYKQLIHEPFLGGGIFTALALTLVFTIGWQKLLVICLAMFIIWTAVAILLIRRNRK